MTHPRGSSDRPPRRPRADSARRTPPPAAGGNAGGKPAAGRRAGRGGRADAATVSIPPGKPVGPRGGDAGAATPRRHATRAEQKVHGVRACEALFARRPGDVIRVYVSASRKPTFKKLLEHCATRRLGFQIVDGASLDRLAGGLHHEGIVILAREPERPGTAALLAGVADGTIRGPLVYLDGVQNPHNLGSILRSAAHFGCGAVIGAAGDLPPLSAAAMRVAEGGAEFVRLFALDDPPAALAALGRAGLSRVTTTSRTGDPVAAAGLTRDVVLILGSEAEGVSPRISKLADRRVRIPGSGNVQSLNVAVAAGIVLAEACRGTGRGPDAAGE